jgi:hypothetical protein
VSSKFRIGRKGVGCGVCERVFAPGDEFISAIYEAVAAGEGASQEEPEDEVRAFERLDTCPGCFEKVERPAYSHWLTSFPLDEAKQPLLDLGMARDFLVRLCREENPERQGLVYILTLLLLRKRRVKLLTQRVDPETEATVMDCTVKTGEAEEIEEISVPVCELSEEETKEIEAELGRLFGLA